MGLLRCTCLILFGVFACAPVVAQTEFDVPPPSALAWWSMDPAIEPTAAARSQRRLVEATLSTILSSGMVGGADAIDVISGLLIASTIGATSHQFTLLELEGAPEGELIGRMKGVLEIRGPVDHTELVRVLQTVLVDASDEHGEQRTMQLPGRRSAVAFRRLDWPEWLEVAWTSGDGVFYVGIGVDALSGWPVEDASDAPWDAHVNVVNARGGDRMLTVYMNIDGLRHAAPAWFAHGSIGADVLTAWSLSNARQFMLHAALLAPVRVQSTGGNYEGPPLLVIDATWEARSEPAGTIRRREVTGSQWPGAELSMTPPPGRFAIVAPTQLLAWIERGVRTRLAMIEDQQALYSDSRRWAGRTQGRIRRLQRASSAHVILGDAAAGTTRLPLLGTAYLEVDAGIELASYEREIGILARTLGDAIAYDEAARIWSVPVLPESLDPSGSLSLVAWGMAQGEQPVLVVGWGKEAVEEARRRLSE